MLPSRSVSWQSKLVGINPRGPVQLASVSVALVDEAGAREQDSLVESHIQC